MRNACDLNMCKEVLNALAKECVNVKMNYIFKKYNNKVEHRESGNRFNVLAYNTVIEE